MLLHLFIPPALASSEPPCARPASPGALVAAAANSSVLCIELLARPYALSETLMLGARALTLQGAGATLSAAGTRVVSIQGPGVVKLVGLRISGGVAHTNGGAGLLVSANGTAVLANVTVSGNQGGGVLNGGRLTLTNANVSANKGGMFGMGGVANAATGELWMERTVVASNSPGDYTEGGGGLYNTGGRVSARDCTFAHNHAVYGGGIYTTGGHVELQGCVVEGNSADNGGGISQAGGGLSLDGCDVRRNNATNLGGGLDVRNVDSVTNATASTIRHNMAGHGGGGASNQGRLWLLKTSVSNNSASLGGGLYNGKLGTARIIVDGSNLTGNVADGATSPVIAGAALYNDRIAPCMGGDAPTAVLVGALVRGNVAKGAVTTGATIFTPPGSAAAVVIVLPAPGGHYVYGVPYECERVVCPNPSELCKQICDFRNESGCLARRECFGGSTLINVSNVADDFPPACLAGFYGNGTAVAEQTRPSCSGLCPAGRLCPTQGTVAPLPCDPGRFCPPGAKHSFPCSSNTYGNGTALTTQAECNACPRNSHSPPGSVDLTDCRCDEGHYLSEGGGGCPECAAGAHCCCSCPIGAHCPENSVTATLRLRAGFWRQSGATPVARPCPINATCAGDLAPATLGDYCDHNRTGIDSTSPYCSRCLAFPSDYLDEALALCRPCAEARWLGVGLAAAALALALALLALFRWLGGAGAASVAACGAVRARALAARGGALRERLRAAGVTQQTKTLLGFYQIVTHLRATYGLVMPPSFISFSQSVGVFNLDPFARPLNRPSSWWNSSLLPALPAATIGSGLLLLLSGGATAPVGTISAALMPPLDLVRLPMLTLSTSRFALPGLHVSCFGLPTFFTQLLARALAPLVLLAAALLLHRARGRLADALPFALWLTFLVFSLVASPAFLAFSCEQFDDGRAYLRADWGVQCWDKEGRKSGEYRAIQALALVVIAVYPVGVPLGYAALLFSTRGRRLGESVAFLTAHYAPHAFYWELVDTAKRLLLGSFYVLVLQGRMLQLLLALATQLGFVIAAVLVAPHRLRAVRFFALGADVGLLLALLCCVVIKQQTSMVNWQTLVFELTDEMPPALQHVYGLSNEAVAPLLLTSTGCVLVAWFGALLLVALPLHGWRRALADAWRRCARGCQHCVAVRRTRAKVERTATINTVDAGSLLGESLSSAAGVSDDGGAPSSSGHDQEAE